MDFGRRIAEKPSEDSEILELMGRQLVTMFVASVFLPMYCGMNCGDISGGGDGLIISRDALTILSCDVRLSFPNSVGYHGCSGGT